MIQKTLRSNTSLHTLDLSDNNVGTERAIELAIALTLNSILHTLYLSINNVNLEGTVEIAKMLTINTTLHVLDLQLTNINVCGAIEIAKSLTTNNTLRTLNLSINNIEREVIGIANILESNYSLTNIDLGILSDNHIIEIIDRNKKIFKNMRFVKTKNAII